MACGTSAALLRQVSRQSSNGELENLFSEELEFLQNVYFDEMTYEPGSHDQECHALQFHVTPSTGDDKERQYVYVVLNIAVPKEYPLISPELTVGQSRGLSDAHLRSIQEGLHHKAEGMLGCQMIYELVEFAKECLTDNNLPSGECAICLCGFQESENFRKTNCYHYFHLSCLAWYMEYHQRQVREDEEEDSKKDIMLRKKTIRQFECPVCRVPISNVDLTFNLAQEWSTLHLMDTAFTPSAELRVWQKNMEELLWKQRLKGGVIDPTQSDVIDPTWVSTVSIKTKEESTKAVPIQDNTQSQAHKDSADNPKKRPGRTKNGYYRYRKHPAVSNDDDGGAGEQRHSAPRQRRNRPRGPVEGENLRKPQSEPEGTVDRYGQPQDTSFSPSSVSRKNHDYETKSKKGQRQKIPSNADKPPVSQRTREQRTGGSGKSSYSKPQRVRSGDGRRRPRESTNDGDMMSKTCIQEQAVSKPENKNE